MIDRSAEGGTAYVSSKIIGSLAVFALVIVLGIPVASLAGEKMKSRTVLHKVKWEQINVGDEEGHVVAVFESRGIAFDMLGTRGESTVRQVGTVDVNTKTGNGVAYGFDEHVDREGNKTYSRWEGSKRAGDAKWTGTWMMVKGTGVMEGVKGKGTWVTTTLSPTQSYDDSEGEWEAPAR